jgi:two-component system LytT family response regulator
VNKIKAILVDDEASARDVLENLLLRFCPEVELVAKCENLLQSVEAIKATQPQLVFLDIEMPNYAGYEIVNFFHDIDFKIVFVTAYDQYAIRAFEIAALDYLLKPIDINRLKGAVARTLASVDTIHQQQSLPLLTQTLQHKTISNIAVTDKGQQYIIPINEIIAIEAQESYCSIYTLQKIFTASKNLRHFETSLEDLPQFIRTHKSWIIQKSFVKHYSKSDFTIMLHNGIEAKLSKYKKTAFEAAIML